MNVSSPSTVRADVVSRPAEFFSGGTRLAARIYSTAGPADGATDARRRPGVVVCNGMRGVKEWIVPPFGEAFAAAGYVAVVFDHRGLGGSEGEVGRVIPAEQIEDVRSAVSFLQTLPEVDPDRIVAWGTSYGGANAICAAAADDRIKAVATQVPFGDWGRVMRQTLDPDKYAALVAEFEADRLERARTGVSAFTSPDRMLDNDESRQAKVRSSRDVGERPELLFTYESVERSFEYRPEKDVHSIAPRPLLIIGSLTDGVIPFSESQSLYDHAREPKQLHAMEIGHYDICEPPGSDEAARIAIDFLAPTAFGEHA